MFAAFVRSWWGYLRLGYRLVQSLGAEGWLAVPKRLVIFALGWLLFGLLNLLHWIGFLLDEIFCPRYRQVVVERPISIIGVPRSGTTFLQRVLAEEPRFTTLTLFECIIAPSVTERRFWYGLGRLFGWLRPRRLPWVSGWLERMESIHAIGLDEPEEDFLLLLWVHACFLAVVLCPEDRDLWRLTRFDRTVPDAERQVVFGFYYRCLQKHLYFHNRHRELPLRLLSKNPSFTPMVRSLRERFPDITLVACVREPEKTVPSQLSSLLPAFELVGRGDVSPLFRQRMIDALKGYYAEIGRYQANGIIPVVPMARLNEELEQVVREVLDRAGLEASDGFSERLAELGQGGRRYQSAHRYSPDDFGLTEDEIRRSFSAVWPLSLTP